MDARLTRYLKQIAELGGPELYLERMDRAALVQAARTPRRRASAETSVPAETDAPPAPDGRANGDGARRLLELAQVAQGCTLCRLHAERKTVVFGEGNASAELVVVGEAPGQEEDRTGRPFVGRAGKLLDLLLAAVGFPRADVYICNVLKCRPPQNRNPLPDEMDVCTRNFLHAQLAAIGPRALLAVGRFAATALLSTEEAIGRLRGRIHEYQGIPLVVSYHPAFLLRSPNMVRAAWSDYQLVRKVIDEHR